MNSFWINDEDFLLDEARGRGFLEAIRRSKLPPLSLSIFSSVKALTLDGERALSSARAKQYQDRGSRW